MIMIGGIFCAAVLSGCSGTDSEVADTQLDEERKVNSSNARVPIDKDPSAPYVHAESDNDNLISANIGGIELVPSNSILENAESHPDLTTFIGAVKKAGLVRSLDGTGPYTFFAPTNEAFEALPEGTIEELMKPENRQQLTELVNNHVVVGKLNAMALKSGSTIKTVSNGQIKASGKGTDVMINGAHVLTPDIVSSNGVIHVIDKVLIPTK
jgi:uncharacterized surface protein with fasciclin (FAS1) repeats